MAGFDDITGPNSLLGDRGEELLKRRSERINQRSKKEAQNIQRMAKNLQELDQVTSQLEMAFEDRMSRITQLNTSIEEIKRQQQQSLQNRTQIANNQFRRNVGSITNMQAQRSDIAQLAQSSSLYSQSYGLAHKYSTPELEQALTYGQSQLKMHNDRVAFAAENIGGEGSEDAFRRAMSSRDKSLRDVARARQAIGIQRSEGLDLASQHRRGMSLIGGIRSHADQLQLREDVAAGRVKRSDVEEKLARVTDQLIKSFNELDKAVSSNANNAGRLAMEFGEVASQYDRHSETLKEMDRQGIGSGGGRAILGGIAASMGGGAQMINAYAQYQQYANVQAPLMDIQNRTMIGGIANQRFQDAYGATQGNVSSIRRVLSDSFADAVKESMRIGQSQRDVIQTQRAGAGLEAGGGILSSLLSLTPFGGGSKAARMAQGLGQAATTGGSISGSTSQFAQLGVDLDRQISQSQVFGQGFNAMRAMQDAMSHIDDFAGQKGLDRFTSLGMATRGLGTGAAEANWFSARSMSGTGALSSRASAVRDKRVMTPANVSESARATFEAAGIDINDPAQLSKLRQNARRYFSGEEGEEFGGMLHPTGGIGRVTSSFGPRVPPTPGASAMHKGTDIGAPLGTPIYSMTDAIVKRMGYQKDGAGYYTVLGNDQEEFTYMHQLNQSNLKIGQRIKAGQQIGQVGNTGTSTGPHLDVRGKNLLTGEFFDLENIVDFGGGRGINTTVGQGGGRRESALQRLTNPEFMKELASRGLGREQDLARIIGTGVAGLGVEMGRGLEGTLRGAGGFTQAGYFQSPEQYMQARSALTGVGGTGDDLKEIMKTAVAAGMDSSKNIMEMVSATQNVAQRSAIQGTMAVQGAAGSLSAAINASSYLPENMRTAAALQSANVADSLATSTDLTLGNLIEAAQIRAAIGPEGLEATNLIDQENLRKMSPAQYRQMVEEYSKSDKAGQKYMEETFGTQNIEKVIPNLQVARGIATAGMSGAVFNSGAAFGDIEGFRLLQRKYSARRKGIDPGFSAEERKKLQLFERGVSKTLGTSAAINSLDFGDTGLRTDTADATINIAEQAGSIGGLTGSTERISAAKGVADTNLSIEGMGQFKKAFGGLEAIGTNLQGIADQLKASDFAAQTKQAMDNLQAPIGTFSETMRGLNTDMEVFSKQISTIVGALEKGQTGGKSDLTDKLDRLINVLTRNQNNPLGGNTGTNSGSKFGGND